MGKVPKVVVLVRTRNEELNIERFCQNYQWAYRILVADGGSKDSTVRRAWDQKKTLVRGFYERTEMQNGLWRNPAGEHINFLIDWGIEYNPDWLIFDDCDSIPTRKLREDAFDIFDTDKKAILVPRLHIYGKDLFFKKMSVINKIWQGGLWAWRPSADIRFVTNKTNHTHELEKPIPDKDKIMLSPPYALLHYFCPTEDITKRKLDFYVNSGQHPTAVHPKEYYGKPVELPEWAYG